MNKKIFIAVMFFILSCMPEENSNLNKRNANEVIVHQLADPDMLNPVNSTGAGAEYIENNIFQTLLGIDFKTLELIPILAKSRPEITKLPEGKVMLTYSLRPEAKWDNGDPITAKDVEFSLKVIKNPKVDNMAAKPYYEFITDMIFYEDDPYKFSFIAGKPYILAESVSGGFFILPKYIYDPEGLMDEFTIKQLNEKSEELLNNKKIIKFANEFNSEKFQRERGFIVGSGPYEFVEWKTGQQIIIKRKKDWWGDKLSDLNMYYEAFPEKIIYKTINDLTTALVALKGGDIDIMSSIKPKDFKELPNSESFVKNFNTFTPPAMAYTYIGINMKNPKFKGLLTRQALAHLVDVDKIIKIIAYGYGQRVTGPIHPSKKKDYNFNIKPYDYNLKKAKELLSKDGWKDSDGDGMLDKIIDGQKVDFTIQFTYNTGNDIRKSIGLMFQEEARKVGIKVEVIAQEWSIFLDRLKHHNFEVYTGAWISTPAPSDPKQIWHTTSYNGGSNYVGFGNDETDALIDSIRVTLDENKRAEMYKRLQKIIYEQVPYIFLYAPTNLLAINKRFDNLHISAMRPGYWTAGFKLVQ